MSIPAVLGVLCLSLAPPTAPGGEPGAEPGLTEPGVEPGVSASDVELESAEDANPPDVTPETSAAGPSTAEEAPSTSEAADASTSASKKAPNPSAKGPASPGAGATSSEAANATPSKKGPKIEFKAGKGLTVTSEDGRFSLATRLRAQFLYTFGYTHADTEASHSFQIRRARLQFGGHMFGKHNKFKAEFAFSPRDMGMKDGVPTRTPILDWYAEFDYLRDLTLRVGQYKVPYSRQRVISSGDLELVDRALAQSEFNLDRDVGLDLRSQDFLGLGYLRYYAGAYLGEGRDPFQATDFSLFYLGRVEVLPFGGADGKWDYAEADLDRLERPHLSLGTAYAFVDDGTRNQGILGSVPTDGGTTDFHNATADFLFKVRGFSLMGEFFWRKGVRDFGDATVVDEMGNTVPAPLEAARNGVGWFAQAGYVVPKIPLQIAARYSQVRKLGSDTQTSLVDEDEVGGGISYYFAGHPFKLQLDYFRGWEDGTIVDGSDRVRLQLQLAF